MSTTVDLIARERNTLRQYADWYAQQGYQVLVEPAARDLPDFLRGFAPDLVARRNGENVVVEIKTSSSTSSERVERLANALQHRAGWTLQVVYADLADPEWEPPEELPRQHELTARLESLAGTPPDDDRRRLEFLVLWSIIEAAARHQLAAVGLPATDRISSSALIKMLLTEGIIEDDEYALLRQGLAVRNAIAHGFLNQPVAIELFERVRDAARAMLPQTTTPSA